MNAAHRVAIVGVGGLFPGARTLDGFWQNVLGGVDAAREAPPGRWALELDDVYAPGEPSPDRVYSRRACFVEDFAFDAHGLNLPPDLADALDPMFHFALHAARAAVDDAGTKALGARVGAIFGNIALPTDGSSRLAEETLGRTFEETVRGESTAPETPTHPWNRFVAGLPAGLMAQALGLNARAFTLDAACASSLYAVKLAVDEILADRADAMLCGGVCRPDSLYTQMGFSQLRALSPSGRCAPFDARGDGLVVGEGAGMFVLKRLDRAIADGDRIRAVIAGCGLSNDIGGNLLAPDSEGQLRAMRDAYEAAGWSPDDVDLIECHATGTPVGDAVEFESLCRLRDGGDTSCVIGSVKSNVGHLLTAAGAAGLMKVLFALRDETLPPSANFERPHDGIDLDGSPYRILSAPEPWARRTPTTPRRAAISGFGLGGINAHLLVEEYVPSDATPAAASDDTPGAHEPDDTIAIVGIGAHFGPWRGRDAVRARLLGSDDDTPPSTPRWWGLERTAWFDEAWPDTEVRGHFIDAVALDPRRFRIPPRELESMLPQQLVMLDVADEAVRDAGLDTELGPRAGVFIGIGLDLNTTNFHLRWVLAERARAWADAGVDDETVRAWTDRLRDAIGPPLTADRTMGALGGIVASRVARHLRVGGPAFTLSSEETSGLTAIEVAARALALGDVDVAVAGAVDLAGDPRAWLGTHADRRFASGALVGDGAAAFVLKRHADARRDGDRIYGVVRGIRGASGADGDVTPHAQTLATAIRDAAADAGTPIERTRLLVAQASGLTDDDRSEADALAALGRDASSPALVATANARLGHTGAASGVASMLLACWSLHHRTVPAWAPTVERLDAGPAWRVADSTRPWLRDRDDGPRHAGVDALGVDGGAVHAILAEDDAALRPYDGIGAGLFALECDSPEDALARVDALAAFVDGREGDVEHLAAAWYRESGRRPDAPLAVAIVARDRLALGTAIDRARQGLSDAPEQRRPAPAAPTTRRDHDELWFWAPEPLGPTAEVAFVYPGSGSAFPQMGVDVMHAWPSVVETQDQLNRRLASQFADDAFGARRLDGEGAALLRQVALGALVTDVVTHHGVRADAAIGYSLGESASLFALGAWRERDEMLARLEASPLFREELGGEFRAARRHWDRDDDRPLTWITGVVDRDADAVRAVLSHGGRWRREQQDERAFLLIVNAPGECVIGGDRAAVNLAVERLGCNFFAVDDVTIAHCPIVASVADDYRALHDMTTTAPEGVRFYGSAAEPYEPTRDRAADAILAQASGPIDFPRVVERAWADGVRIFIEMGPGQSCTRMIDRILSGRPHVARAACPSGRSGPASILRVLADAIVERKPVDLDPLYGVDDRRADRDDDDARALVIPVGGERFAPEPPPAPPPPPPPVEVPSEPTVPAPAAPTWAEPDAAPIAPIAPHSVEPTPTPAPATSTAADEPLTDAVADAHAAYLRWSLQTTEQMSALIAKQSALIQRLLAGESLDPATVRTLERETAFAPPPLDAEFQPIAPPPPAVFDRAQCLALARGRLADVLGDAFAEVDSFPTRVRLPDEPLMLVDRIVALAAEPRTMTRGNVVTEKDVRADDWYLDNGVMPTAIAVESGQADLFLSGYLGIDFVTRGLACYRLLDAEVTFHRTLPRPGDVIRYDIHIDEFFRQGETHLFRFRFDATVNGEPMLTMRKGCAGFFTDAELAAGQGIVHTKLDLMPRDGKRPDDWRPLVPIAPTTLDASALDALRDGDLARAFGDAFAGLPIARPLTIPGGDRLRLIDRIVELDPTAGRFGLGRIRAEQDIAPDAWFLTCHFVDDRVMPGTLMYECSLHTLRVLLLRMGWVADADRAHAEPVPGVGSKLKCRGQVIETTRVAAYEVTLKEIGFDPAPYAIADTIMYADDKPIVEITDMTVRLAGETRESIEAVWADAAPPATTAPLFDRDRILAFAIGKPSDAFGDRYLPFDGARKIARLPGPPFQFLDRIVSIDGCEPWVMRAGGDIVAHYDVPADAWYFDANRQETMPFAVILETALQPCGWLAAYVGSALTSDVDLRFRNLGGKATLHRALGRDAGTLATRVRMTSVSSSGGMVIQHYTFSMTRGDEVVYDGTTYFGFFSHAALANQVGLRDADRYAPDAPPQISEALADEPPFPAPKFRMLDTVTHLDRAGGRHGLGFIRGTAAVDPGAWFFAAHFYEDPVWPGSLGLESFLQVLKRFAADRWGTTPASRFEPIAVGRPHAWTYRGQVIPTDREVTVEAEITAIDDDSRLIVADGFLIIDGRVIYQMTDFALRMS